MPACLRAHVSFSFSYPGTQTHSNDPSVFKHCEFLSLSHKSLAAIAASKHSSISKIIKHLNKNIGNCC